MNCPNKSLKDWNDLVDKVGVQKAYMIFIKNGNKVPYLQSRESNRMVWDIENAKGLVTWEKVGNANVKRYKGFDRDSAQTIIENIRNEYVGDYIIKRISPDTKGEFGIKIEGFPIDRKLWDEYVDSVEEDKRNYEDFKQAQEFKARMIEANEFIIPPDTDISTFDTGYEQRISTVKEGVYFVFEQYPELSSIGTQVQYSQYLSTIFPNSKVKDVLYHGTDIEDLQQFSLKYFGQKDVGDRGYGIYLSKNKNTARSYGDYLYASVVNIQNPYTVRFENNDPSYLWNRTERNDYVEEIKNLEKSREVWRSKVNDNDTAYGFFDDMPKNSTKREQLKFVTDKVNSRIKDKADRLAELSIISKADGVINADYEIVTKPEQIHILGSKADIAGFKNYTRNNTSSTPVFEKQKDILSKVMPQVKEIIEDRSLTVAGRLDSNGETITVNPDYMTKDTLGHEYGHLLIDLRGGMKDPFIQQGRKQLEGTPIERRVMDLYPELYGTERFDKEVLAQAIGEEVADIFDSAEKRNIFAEWLLRLFKWLGTRTGITKNNARELARQLTGETELDISRFTDLPSSYIQEQRAENADDITDKDIEEAAERIKTHEIKQDTKSRLEILREQAEDITATRLRTISHKGNSSDTKRLQDVLTELRDETSNNSTALRAFVTNAVNHINRTYSTYLDLKAKEAKGNKDAFNIRMIERWYDIFAGYDVLDDVASYITSEYNILDQSTTKKYISLLNDAINKKNTIRDMYKTKGIELLSDDLSKYSTRLIIEERENKKKEWLKLSIAERKGESMEQYSENYIKENMVDIVKRSKALLAKEMQVASDDINWLQRWLDTILDSNDMVLASTVKKIAIADQKARAKSIEFKDDLIGKLRKLEESINYSHYTGKIEDLYDFMLEKDSKGKYTGHILTKFSSQLMNEYRAVLDSTSELPLEQRWAERNKWKEANMPLDRKRRDEDLTAYMKSLIKDNILSEDEYKVYFETANMPFRNRPLLINVMNTEAANHVEEWLVSNSMSYRNPIIKWENKGWKELESILKVPNNPKAEYYNLLKGMLSDIDRSMPFNKRIYSALPVVSKSTLERFQGGEGAKYITKDYFSKTFQKHSDDTEKGINTLTNEQGEPIDFIPTRYLRNKNYDLADQSFDLSTIYYLYNRMANNYIEKSDVQPEAELVKTIAQTRKYTVRDSKGNVINKVLDARKNKALTKSGSKALIVDQYSDFLKLVMYGQSNVDEGDYNVFGYKVDKAKAHGLLGKYTAYNMLGLNVIQGLSNINMGELQQMIEGIANEYISVKDLHYATVEYSKNLFSIVGDIGSRSKNNVVNALNEKFDILNEYEGGEFRKNSKFANLTMSDALFFMAHSGEHFMQSRVMIAMLKKKIAFDSNGKELGSMYDMYKVENGKLIIDKRVDLDKSNWNEEDQILYGLKIKRLLARLHGEYTELGRSAVQKYSLGRLGIMFRKFIVPGFKKRFEKKTPNEFLEEYTEGSYRELGHFFKQLGKSIYQLKLSMITDHWSNLLPREKSNVKRAVSEVMAMFMFGILATAFLALKGESDDDDEKMLYGNMAYLALRGRSELSFYYNPVEAMAILRSPAASMSTIENILKMLGGVMPPDFTLFERYERGAWKGKLKLEKNLMNFVPAYRQYYRIRDIDDVLTNFSR